MPVFFVSKGLPGRGLTFDRGVDSSTGTLGTGVPSLVTRIVAFVIDGFGLGEAGEEDGVGVTEPLL